MKLDLTLGFAMTLGFAPIIGGCQVREVQALLANPVIQMGEGVRRYGASRSRVYKYGWKEM